MYQNLVQFYIAMSKQCYNFPILKITSIQINTSIQYNQQALIKL